MAVYLRLAGVHAFSLSTASACGIRKGKPQNTKSAPEFRMPPSFVFENSASPPPYSGTSSWNGRRMFGTFCSLMLWSLLRSLGLIIDALMPEDKVNHMAGALYHILLYFQEGIWTINPFYG